MAKISASAKKRLIAQLKRRKLSPADLARRGLFNRTLVLSGRFEAARLMFERRLGVMKGDETAKDAQHELERFRKKQMAAAKKALAAIKDPFRYGIKERDQDVEALFNLPPTRRSTQRHPRHSYPYLGLSVRRHTGQLRESNLATVGPNLSLR